jgi:hypothetical protein
MNEATAMPVEAVNLGVNGYNIWNSWLSFKEMPQVYDGVVFTLCNNDAQLFGRSFEVDYRNADPVLWQPGHPYRGAIVACFDEIAAFAAKVPVLICYCNLWPGKPFEEIADTMRALCEARRLPFVNFHTHLAERRIAQAELIVSPADHHPSALAHDAMARHLTQELRKIGWLAPAAGTDLATAFASVASIAAAMVTQDDYPADAAIEWARTAVEAKRRLATRLDPSGPEILSRADAAAARLADARRIWQKNARTAAIVEQLSTSERGVSGALNHVEEELLRLEELDHAIDTGGWAHIAADLLKSHPDAPHGATHETVAVRSRIAQIDASLASLCTPRPDMPESEELLYIVKGDRDGSIADRDDAQRFAGLTRERLGRLDSALARIAGRLGSGNGIDPDGALALSNLAKRSASMAMERFERLHTALLQAFNESPPESGETTIDAQIRTNKIEGRHPCLVEVIANCTAPRRLPTRESRYFLPDGEPKLLAMRLPLFYAGRIVVSLRLPPAVAESIDADVTEVRLANMSGRRTIARAEFITDSLGRLLSPQVWLV